MYKAVAANKRNTIFMIVLFLVIIGGLGALAAYIYRDYTVVIFVVAAAGVYALIQYFAASHIAMAISGGHEVAKKDAPELYRIVENLSITTGIPMPRVFVIDDPAPNAFATGRNPKHAMVAVTTGLMEVMDKRELEAVMAHEISHVQNYDILVSMVVFGLVSAIGMICDYLLRITFWNRNDRDSNPILMIIGLGAMIIAPLVALLVKLALSRQREYLADMSGVLITRDSEGMAAALEKLRQHSRPMRRQNTSVEHLFITSPLKSGFISKLFSTHPPLDERIKRLRDNAEKM
ncbi:MAG: M48 family metalloprotease [Candidatus Nomurabacteria bacterium]|jgi:heat shock protein HtpX|nr:M48 family metalloprotease [Candidatus Nomurabacteria bacterium]